MSDYNTKSLLNSDDFVKKVEKLELSRLIDPALIESLTLPYKIRVGIYLRVSTPGQAKKEKVSLSEQESQIKEICKRNSWEIIETYCDGGKSGGNSVGRDDFNKLIEDAYEGKFDVMMGWSTDRFARNVDEMTQFRVELRKHKVQVTTVKEPTEIIDPRKIMFQENESLKKVLAYLLDWNAEVDKKKIAERFRLGKIGKAKKGIIPAKVPYGMKKSIHYVNGDPLKKVEKDIGVPQKIAVVKEIFDLYDKNSWGMRRIAEHLNLKGVPAPRGGKWCYSTIKYTLQNPTYCGLVRYGWRLSQTKESRTRLQQGHQGLIVDGQHEVFVTPDQFKRVQDKLTRRSKLGGKAVHSKGLLTGILKCGRCGGGAYLSSYDHWLAYEKDKKDRGRYTKSAAYLCGNYSQYGRSGCTKRYILSQGKIENIVIQKIKELANNKTTQEEFVKQMKKNKAKDIEKELIQLEKAKQELDKQKTRLKDAYLKGVIPLSEYEQDVLSLDSQDRDIFDRINKAKVERDREFEIERQSKQAILALTNFDEIWEKSDFLQKKDLLQTIIEKITVTGGKVDLIFRNSE